MKLQKIDTNDKPRKSPKWVITFLLSLVLLVVIINTFLIKNSQQFADLANSFLNLKLYFLHPIGNQTQNPVYYKGKEFFDDGPFPAIILMPFEALFKLFHLFFYQGYLQWILIILTLNIIYKIAKLIGFKKSDALLLAFTFILGSVYIGVAINSSSWYFAQVITTYLLFLIIYEYFTKKRWWLLGLLSAFILLSRVSAFAIIFLLILDILFNYQTTFKTKFNNLLKLGLPIVLAGISIGLYNYLRFSNPFNGGYLYQAIDQTASYSRSKGLFSIKHIPFNFYHLFFGTPIINTPNNNWIANFPYFENNPLGLSIFITSPYLIFLFYQSRKLFHQKEIIFLLISALVALIIVLTYFGVGTYQFGYRYSLDFLPEIFTIFMLIYHKTKKSLTFGMKFLFLLTIIFNFYLILSFI